MAIRLRYYLKHEIDDALIAVLKKHKLHNPPLDGEDTEECPSGGLLRVYWSYTHLKPWADGSHFWVLWADDQTPIGVACMVDDSLALSFHCFIDPAYRGQGHGTRLIEEALKLGESFYVFFTEDNKHLYQKYQLADMHAESTPPTATE